MWWPLTATATRSLSVTKRAKSGCIHRKQLITGDVQLFSRSEMEVRAGDLLKFTATDKEQGQMANQRYTVESVSETGISV
jgi:hypothetical protein